VSRTLGRRSSVTGGFQYENGRTISDPIQSCSRFGQCTPEDINQSLFGRGVTIVSVAGTHDRTNNIVDPSRGSRYRTELRAGQTSSPLASSVRFYRTTGEASAFLPFLGGVAAARLQISRAFAPGVRLADGLLIPAQERLFGGGQNSVRGYQQNLLGPLIYQINDVRDTVVDGVPVKVVASDTTNYVRVSPRGGTALTVLNLEYRRAVRWFPLPLQIAAFVDAGNVWEVQTDPLKFGDLRATPGIGFRFGTPVGPFRIDIGYRPYEANAGRAFYFEPASNGNSGRILCVSPGNLISADPGASGDISECPATYRPPRNRGVLSRLAFHFGLGQAF
jgi:outer membrane protein assembly factor BamA